MATKKHFTFKRSSIAAALLVSLGTTAANAATITVNTLDDIVDGGDAFISLREALTTAQTNSEDDVIVFDSSVTGTMTLSSQISASSADGFALSIQGPGQSVLAIQSQESNVDLFDFNGFSSVSISNLTLTVNSATDEGTGGDLIYAYGNSLTLDSVTISNPAEPASVTPRGVDTGHIVDLTISNSTISGMKASYGAAVYAGFEANSTISISNSRFENNYASSNGGAIEVYPDFSSGGKGATVPVTLNINNSTFINNSASENGGVVYFVPEDTSNITISNNTFENNSSGAQGGALNLYIGADDGEASNVIISNNTFKGNSSASGGALFLEGSNLSSDGTANSFILNSNTLTQNSASQYGGAISFFTQGSNSEGPTTLNIVNTTIHNNDAQVYGGGIFTFANNANVSAADPTLSLNIINSTITSNSANYGGGALTMNNNTGQNGYSDVSIVNTVVANNTGSSTDNNDFNILNGTTVDTIASNLFSTSTTALDSAIDDTTIIGEDPVLSELGDNGGTTQTQVPEFGSPLIDSGDDSFLSVISGLTISTDQRGFGRVAGSGLDIGAVETDGSINFGSGGAGDVSDDPLATASSSTAWLFGLSFLLPLLRRRK